MKDQYVKTHYSVFLDTAKEIKIPFKTGSSNGITPYIEIENIRFHFCDDGKFIEIEREDRTLLQFLYDKVKLWIV
jgi:phage anti-repressor protein